MPCEYKFGCHECSNKLMFLHAQIRQFLREPEVNKEKIRNEILAVKRLIEDIVGVGEDEVRGVE